MFNKVVVNWQTIVELNFKFCINKNPIGLPVGMSTCNDELLILDINFSENTLFDIMVDEGTIDKKGIPLECPYCNNHKFVHKNVYCDEISEVEYDEVCNKCGHPLMHFAYGQREILPF